VQDGFGKTRLLLRWRPFAEIWFSQGGILFPLHVILFNPLTSQFELDDIRSSQLVILKYHMRSGLYKVKFHDLIWLLLFSQIIFRFRNLYFPFHNLYFSYHRLYFPYRRLFSRFRKQS